MRAKTKAVATVTEPIDEPVLKLELETPKPPPPTPREPESGIKAAIIRWLNEQL